MAQLHPQIQAYLERLATCCRALYGDNLLSLVLYGSVVRGTLRPTSDIDLLVLLRRSTLSWGKRISEFFHVVLAHPDVRVAAARLRELNLPSRVEPLILTEPELATHPPILLDLTEEAMILEDRAGSSPQRSARARPSRYELRGDESQPRHDKQEETMKLLFFDDGKLGVLKGDAVIDVSQVVRDIPHTGPHNLISGLIERFADYRKPMEEAVAGGRGVPVSQVRIRPPLPKPGNIVCMAVNYMEDGTRTEPAPINAFHKTPNAVIGDGDTLVLPDVPATIFEGEAEVAVVIGKRASRVSAGEAMSYVFGYTNFIDGSARGLPPSGNTFYQMKSRDTFAPMGPYLVTADEVPDPHNLQVRLSVNGTLKQNFNTRDMAHKIPRCIEWVSSIHTLEPGDVLATGTNHRGLSAFQDGDRIELEIDRLGRLRIQVRDDLKRSWGRDTRLDRQQKGQEGQTPQLTGKHAPAAR